MPESWIIPAFSPPVSTSIERNHSFSALILWWATDLPLGMGGVSDFRGWEVLDAELLNYSVEYVGE